MFHNQYIVIDNFYSDPYSIRNAALSMPYDPGSGNYAGKMTAQPLWTTNHEKMFEKITNEPVEGAPGLNGYFRFTMAQDRYTQHIHFDPRPGQVWAGLVHLSSPKDLQQHESVLRCGTDFWRHNRTGLDSIPLGQLELESHGWRDEKDIKLFLDTEGMDESLWTRTFYVPAQFNRLVLFRPWLFHSPGRAFGVDAQDCRLVQLFFLRLRCTPEFANDDPKIQ